MKKFIFNKRNLLIFISTIVYLITFVSNPANAKDDCGFGMELDENQYECVTTQWSLESSDDGFDNFISIRMFPDEEDTNNVDLTSMTIVCEKKKLYVNIYTEYADSFAWKGFGQVRFDEGSPRKFSYQVFRNFNGVQLTDSKSFLTNLVKAKNKFSFKIPNVNGYELMIYPKGNLLTYRSTFKKMGCKF